MKISCVVLHLVIHTSAKFVDNFTVLSHSLNHRHLMLALETDCLWPLKNNGNYHQLHDPIAHCNYPIIPLIICENGSANYCPCLISHWQSWCHEARAVKQSTKCLSLWWQFWMRSYTEIDRDHWKGNFRDPFHKGFMSSYSRSCTNMWYSDMKNDDQIMQEFCTCHDRWAVLTFAKLWHNQSWGEKNEIKKKFHKISIMNCKP